MNLQWMIDILKKIFKLPPIPTLLISIPSFVLVIYVLSNDMENRAISYVAYTLSAYAMVITITGMTGIVCLIRQGIENCPFVRNMLDTYLLLDCVEINCGWVWKFAESWSIILIVRGELN